MVIAVVFTKNRSISSPAEAEEFYVVDLDRGLVISGPHRFRARNGGLSKLGEIIARMPLYNAEGIVVSRIGSEGAELVRSSGAKIFRAEGRLEVLVDRLTNVAEADARNIDPGCPCCSLRHG